MVEVPLEIEAELPREFEGAALLASSGLPRKVKIKAPKDSVKLSTAYRADQLLGDIVKVALRGTANDVEKVQQAAQKFVRTVRERRSHLEERLTALQAQVSRVLVASEVAGPGMEKPAAHVIQRTPGGTRRSTAVEAFAEGLRHELRARISAGLSGAARDVERC